MKSVHITRTGQELKTVGKSNPKISTSMRMTPALYDRIEKFQHQCGPVAGKGWAQTAVPMNQLFADLLEGAMDLLEGEGFASIDNSGDHKREALLHSVAAFDKLLKMKDSYRAEYEQKQERKKLQEEYTVHRKKGEESEDDLNAKILEVEQEKIDMARAFEEADIQRNSMLAELMRSLVEDPDRPMDNDGMRAKLDEYRNKLERGHFQMRVPKKVTVKVKGSPTAK